MVEIRMICQMVWLAMILAMFMCAGQQHQTTTTQPQLFQLQMPIKLPLEVEQTFLLLNSVFWVKEFGVLILVAKIMMRVIQ